MPRVATAATVALSCTRPPGSRPLCRGWPDCAGPKRFTCNATLQGGYACGFFEHFVLFAPAFSHRPFLGETRGGIVVQTDRSLRGAQLPLSVTIAGGAAVIRGMVPGGRRARLGFDLRLLPTLHSEDVNISMTLPDGTVIGPGLFPGTSIPCICPLKMSRFRGLDRIGCDADPEVHAGAAAGNCRQRCHDGASRPRKR